MELYRDIAIPIAWPDQTARGDEKWMSFLRKIGVVKNLNFRVGHAAIVLACKKTGEVRYYDFGRYITPRGLGRARSAESDPRLKLHTLAIIDNKGDLLNLDEILNELSGMEEATHGGGRLLCSICKGISFELGSDFAEEVVKLGPILYGALAPKNNSCSRFVAQIMTQALPSGDRRIRSILYPEFIKASPTSNVVNGATLKIVYCYENGKLERWLMSRFQSLRFQLGLLKDNFTRSGAGRLGDDRKIGHTAKPERHPAIPAHAQWLGGIGEGRWYVLDLTDEGYYISRYQPEGRLEYAILCTPDSEFDITLPYSFTYEIHHKLHLLTQNSGKVAFLTESVDIAERMRMATSAE